MLARHCLSWQSFRQRSGLGFGYRVEWLVSQLRLKADQLVSNLQPGASQLDSVMWLKNFAIVSFFLYIYFKYSFGISVLPSPVNDHSNVDK